MSPSTAAIVLTAAALVVLAFGLAGVWTRVRVLERTVGGLSTEGVRSLLSARDLRPGPGNAYSCLLLISTSCPVCAAVVPVFTDESTRAENVEMVVLSRVDVDLPGDAARLGRVDSAAFSELDPGWQPAIVVLDPDGKVVTTQPAGSETAVRSVVGEVVRRAASAEGPR